MRALASLAVVLALSIPAGAQECVPSFTVPDLCSYRLPLGLGFTPLMECREDLYRLLGAHQYLDNDLCQPECIFSIPFYEETNGLDWLQRDDEWRDDTCQGLVEADTFIF